MKQFSLSITEYFINLRAICNIHVRKKSDTLASLQRNTKQVRKILSMNNICRVIPKALIFK